MPATATLTRPARPTLRPSPAQRWARRAITAAGELALAECMAEEVAGETYATDAGTDAGAQWDAACALLDALCPPPAAAGQAAEDWAFAWSQSRRSGMYQSPTSEDLEEIARELLR